MSSRLKIRHGKKFPPRISHDELYNKTNQKVEECGVNNHFQAEFTKQIAKEVIGKTEYKYESLQPELKLRQDNAWKNAFAVVHAYLADFHMDVTLDDIQIELQGKELPIDDESLNEINSVSYLNDLLEISNNQPSFSERVSSFIKEESIPQTGNESESKKSPIPRLTSKEKQNLFNSPLNTSKESPSKTSKTDNDFDNHSKEDVHLSPAQSPVKQEKPVEQDDGFVDYDIDDDIELNHNDQSPVQSPGKAETKEDENDQDVDLEIDNNDDDSFDTVEKKENLANQNQAATEANENQDVDMDDDFDAFEIDDDNKEQSPAQSPVKQEASQNQEEQDDDFDVEMDDFDDDDKEKSPVQSAAKQEASQNQEEQDDDFDVEMDDFDDDDKEKSPAQSPAKQEANQAQDEQENDVDVDLDNDAFEIGDQDQEKSPIQNKETNEKAEEQDGSDVNEFEIDDFDDDDDDNKVESPAKDTIKPVTNEKDNSADDFIAPDSENENDNKDDTPASPKDNQSDDINVSLDDTINDFLNSNDNSDEEKKTNVAPPAKKEEKNVDDDFADVFSDSFEEDESNMVKEITSDTFNKCDYTVPVADLQSDDGKQEADKKQLYQDIINETAQPEIIEEEEDKDDNPPSNDVVEVVDDDIEDVKIDNDNDSVSFDSVDLQFDDDD